MERKVAFIIGIMGQNGSYLTELLILSSLFNEKCYFDF